MAPAKSQKKDLLFEKALPSNVDAERFVLGSILLKDSYFPQVIAELEERDFSLEKHRRMLASMRELSQRGERIDRVTLAYELDRRGQLESVDGLNYLVSLDHGLPELINIESYIRIIKETSIERSLIFVAARAAQSTMGRMQNIGEVLSATAKDILKLQAAIAPKEEHVLTPQQIIERDPAAFFTPWDVNPGIQTGFEKFDEMVYGLVPGSIYVIAADTRFGKTSLLLNIADYIIRGGRGFVIFTGEMKSDTVIHRMACSSTGLSYSKFRKGKFDGDERQAFKNEINGLMERPLLLDETMPLSIHDFKIRATRAVQEKGAKVIGVDYLQRMNLRNSGDGMKFRDQLEAIDYISGEFMSIAKALGVPLVYLSQFSRAKRMRDKSDRRPKLSDLHGSSSLEKDSHVVVAIYREEFDKPNAPELKGTAELIVLKNRNGPEGTIKMKFLGSSMRFIEVD